MPSVVVYPVVVRTGKVDFTCKEAIDVSTSPHGGLSLNSITRNIIAPVQIFGEVHAA
jgi:hypothetical protein